jgi:hypothetical protein
LSPAERDFGGHQNGGVDPSVLYATAAREIDGVIERLPGIIDGLDRDP